VSALHDTAAEPGSDPPGAPALAAAAAHAAPSPLAGSPPARRRQWRWLLLGSLAVAILAAQVVAGGGALEPQALRQALADLGVWAPVGFIALNVGYNLLTLPAAAMTLLAGLLFGPLWGCVFNVIGATLGAAIAFSIARGLGREAIEARLGGRLRDLDAKLRARGFLSMLILRMVPILPFNFVSYGAGVTGVRFGSFVAATALGITPLVALYAFFGSAAGKALGF